MQKERVLLCRRRRESCRQEVLSTRLQEQISPSRWLLREGEFTLTVDRNGCVQKEKMLQFPRTAVMSSSSPQLENKGGVPHRNQPLHTITPTAKPVLIHCSNDMKHFPTLEAQLVRSCSSVITESPDSPGGSQRKKDEGPYCLWQVTLLVQPTLREFRRNLGSPADMLFLWGSGLSEPQTDS